MPYERQQLFQPTGIDTHAADVHFATIDALLSFKNIVQEVGTPIIAELGARQGLEAGANRQGGTRVPVGPYNRAYNEAFVRAYTLDVYADTEADFLRLEQEAQGDPDRFEQSAQKRREAIMAEVIPEARPYVAASIQERVNAARSRLRLAAIKAAEEGLRASTMRGLDTMRRDVSRLLTTGQEAEQRRGMAIAQEYARQVDLAVRDGTFTQAEGGKLIEAALKANAEDLALGHFEAEVVRPGGDPVKVIREMLESEDPAFDDNDRQRVSAEMMRRLAQKNTLAHAAVAADEAEVQARWAASEKEATIRMLNGTLTNSWLAAQVRTENMDPQLARTLQETAGEDGDDELGALADLTANWRGRTVQEVLTMPGISQKTRIEYVAKVATREADWRDSNAVQEARARIDRELGVSDMTIGMATDEVKLKRNLALTRLDRTLEALSPEEREAEAIAVSDTIVNEVLRSQKAVTLKTMKARRARTIQRVLEQEGADSIADLDADIRTELDKNLQRLDAQEQQLRDDLAR